MSESKKETTAKKTAKKPRIKKVKAEEISNLEKPAEETPIVEEVSEETAIIEEVTQETATEKSKIVEEFDWDTVSNNDSYSSKERTDLEKEYSATLPDVVAKQVIDGVVVLVTDREVVVDINFKSDGVISFNEFKYNPDLKAGDKLDGEGGFCARGRLITSKKSVDEKILPLGLTDGAVVTVDIKKDQVIKIRDVDLNLPKELIEARDYQYNLI